MKLTKDFGFDKARREYWFSITAEIEDKVYQIKHRIPYHEQVCGGPPLDYVWYSMRKQIMEAIEHKLFDGSSL